MVEEEIRNIYVLISIIMTRRCVYELTVLIESESKGCAAAVINRTGLRTINVLRNGWLDLLTRGDEVRIY